MHLVRWGSHKYKRDAGVAQWTWTFQDSVILFTKNHETFGTSVMVFMEDNSSPWVAMLKVGLFEPRELWDEMSTQLLYFDIACEPLSPVTSLDLPTLT